MKNIFLLLLISLIFLLTFACADPLGSSGNSRGNQTMGSSNSPDSVDVGYGRILHDNPIILTGESNLAADIDYSQLLYFTQDFITFNSSLREKCGVENTLYGATADNCLKTYRYAGASALSAINGRWAFTPGSDSFWEVHTFGHVTGVFSKFQNYLYQSYLKANPLGTLGGGSYRTAMPPSLYNMEGFWYQKPLIVYSKCATNPEIGAYFAPASYEICFAPDPSIPHFAINQDPSVIYHEVGHALISILLNARNLVADLDERSEMGTLFYDEGGAIQEGLADFISYGMTKRTHFGEWGVGRFYQASRPLTESDPIHARGISTDSNQRLSYPRYLNYDPNDPDKNNPNINKYEDIHYAGQIFSHFLVALQTDLRAQCTYSFDESYQIVFYALAETLMELGDLTSKQSNNQSTGNSSLQDSVNLSELRDANDYLQSLLWQRLVRPINYRTFMQTFSLKILELFDLSNSARPLNCTSGTGGTYSQDSLEQLLDQYGLLLFKTYNDDRNGFKHNCTLADETTCRYGHAGPLTSVTTSNRIRSLLINKSYLRLPTDEGSTRLYVFDSADSILAIVNGLRNIGVLADISNLIPSDLSYNNSNGKISPGEVVGVALNLKNYSNATMAGIHVLANDWDQGKLENDILKPCNNFSDAWPSASAGAASVSATPSTPSKGDCEHITRTNGNTSTAANDIVSPVCWIQLQGEAATAWVSQETYRSEVGLPTSKCLDTSGNNTYNCFVRVIRGGDQAYFSRIDPNTTWTETFYSNSTVPKFQSSSLLLLEINPWTPPGTTVNCRFRARFTNCDDCWHDPSYNNDDPLDYELSGGKYFQIFNVQFTIND